MSTALSLSALLLSVAAIFAYQWVTFAPWAGLGLLYRNNGEWNLVDHLNIHHVKR